jgi:hypothetical protein
VPRMNPNDGFKTYRGSFDIEDDDYMAVRIRLTTRLTFPPAPLTVGVLDPELSH